MDEDNGEDILCLKIFKKHGYKWAPQYVSPIFREELLHEYNKRPQQVVGARRTPKFKKIKNKMVLKKILNVPPTCVHQEMSKGIVVKLKISHLLRTKG